MQFFFYIQSVHKKKNTRKTLNYTSTDKRKLTWRKFVSKDRKMASLLIY